MQRKLIKVIQTAAAIAAGWLLVSLVSCGFDVNAGIDVKLPIDELRGLVQTLGETANGVIGQAGIEVRQTVGKVSDEIGNRLDQVESMGKSMWKLMYGDLSRELDGIKKFVVDYTKELNNMIAGRIKQIDQALAKRLDQISDMITDTIAKLDDLIQNTIKSVEESAINVIQAGETSTITIVNNTAAVIVRVVIIVILVVAIVIVIVLALKNMLPKSVPAIVIASVFGAVLVGVCMTFMFSNKVMALIFSQKIELVESNQAKEKAIATYEAFIAAYKANPSMTTLKTDGKRVIRNLLSAKYVAKSAADVKELEEKIQIVNAIVYPPPPSGSGIRLGVFSKYYKQRIDLLKIVPRL